MAENGINVVELEKLISAIVIVVNFYSAENPKQNVFTCGDGYNGPGCDNCLGDASCR
jgi:hypothetical protein